MITKSKMRGEASTPMCKLESHATAVSSQFCAASRRCQRSAIVTLQPEEFAQYFAYYALMVPPEGRISGVSHFFPVTID
jgi:hypothetical protein